MLACGGRVDSGGGAPDAGPDSVGDTTASGDAAHEAGECLTVGADEAGGITCDTDTNGIACECEVGGFGACNCSFIGDTICQAMIDTCPCCPSPEEAAAMCSQACPQ